MAQRIGGAPVEFVRHVEVNLNVPDLLTTLCVEEEHVKHAQAIQILGGILDAVARRAVELNDPQLTDLMFKMRLLQVVNEGENYADI
ncbi:MAG: hypothetical protein GY797_38785 [Deltaproteobacteria bacterium]|nr:hypothetical protein [Deltaproteobacteria bacterium]